MTPGFVKLTTKVFRTLLMQPDLNKKTQPLFYYSFYCCCSEIDLTMEFFSPRVSESRQQILRGDWRPQRQFHLCIIVLSCSSNMLAFPELTQQGSSIDVWGLRNSVYSLVMLFVCLYFIVQYNSLDAGSLIEPWSQLCFEGLRKHLMFTPWAKQSWQNSPMKELLEMGSD